MKRSSAAALLLPALVLACTDAAPTAPKRVEPRVVAFQLAGIPDDGAGNKLVIPINTPSVQYTCTNGEVLTSHIEGWVQAKFLDQADTRTLEVDVFHLQYIFTNSAGETFVWRSVGPQRFWTDADGNVVVVIAGRAEADEGHIGMFILDPSTFEVLFSAGRQAGVVQEQACAALASDG